MAQATEYFKTAAANLRRAAMAKQQEIAEARKEIDDLARYKQDEVNQMRDEMHKRETALTLPEPSKIPDNVMGVGRAELTRQVADLHSKAIDAEHEINRIRQDKLKEIDQKQREVADIQKNAKELESRS